MGKVSQDFIDTAAHRRLPEDYLLLCSPFAMLPTTARVPVHSFVLRQFPVGTAWRERLLLQCFPDEHGSTALWDYHPRSSRSLLVEVSQTGSSQLPLGTHQTHSAAEQMLFGSWAREQLLHPSEQGAPSVLMGPEG